MKGINQSVKNLPGSISSLITFEDKDQLEYTSKLLSEISNQAYELNSGSGPSDYEDWQVFNTEMRDGYLFSRRVVIYKHNRKNEYVVGFKGTVSFQDWMDDFSTTPITYKPFASVKEDDSFQTHEGFYQIYASGYQDQSLVSKLMSFVRSYDIDHLYITGHSLGGALAKLFLFDLLIDRQTTKIGKITSVTFAEPCIGYGKAVAQLFERTYLDCINNGIKINYARVIQNFDLVPHLPPKYYHGGQTIVLCNGNPIHHGIRYYIGKVDQYFDREDSHFIVERKDENISLVGGRLSSSGTSLIDLVPEIDNLESLLGGIVDLKLTLDPGPLGDYKVAVLGRNPKNMLSRVRLTFYNNEGKIDTLNINDTSEKWHTMYYNSASAAITKIKYEIRWAVGVKNPSRKPLIPT